MLAAGEFCRLVDLPPLRFAKQRERQRPALELADVLAVEDLPLLPIAPAGVGVHARFDAFDALRMRAVVELERGGLAFGAACRFIRSSGISPAVMFTAGEDHLAASWLAPDGSSRRVSGSARDLSRAMPPVPPVGVVLNISAIRKDVARRAAAQLGLHLEGVNFVKESAD